MYKKWIDTISFVLQGIDRKCDEYEWEVTWEILPPCRERRIQWEKSNFKVLKEKSVFQLWPLINKVIISWNTTGCPPFQLQFLAVF